MNARSIAQQPGPQLPGPRQPEMGARLRSVLRKVVLLCLALLTLLALAKQLRAQVYGKPKALDNIDIEQQLGGYIPADAPFLDEQGNSVTLADYQGKPTILALVYFECPSLCTRVLNGMVRSLRELDLQAGSDYEVVAVSFDPRDTPEVAAEKKANYMEQLHRPDDEASWHFLTGRESSSRQLADSLGYRYAFDESTGQYVHPSSIMLLDPSGKITRYLYGIEYPVRDVRLGLVEASAGQVGDAVDQILLYCFHYDPQNGKYGFMIVNVLRAAGILTVVMIAGLIFLLSRRGGRYGRCRTPEPTGGAAS